MESKGKKVTLPRKGSDLDKQSIFDRKLLYGLKKIKGIASLEDDEKRIDALRRLRNRFNDDITRAFAHYFLCHVIPTNVWNGSKHNTRLGMLCTIQDEAFVLLIMMNNWKVWELMAKGDKRGRGSSSEINSLSLFTNKKAKFGDKEQVVKGWNMDGIWMGSMNSIKMYNI